MRSISVTASVRTLRVLGLLALVAGLLGADDKPVDLGATDQKKAPTRDELRPPQPDQRVPTVEQQAEVTGKLEKSDSRNLYILVNPLSNANVKDVWWVQEAVSRSGEKYSAACQFGDESAGKGEFFAIVGIATDQLLTVGQQLRGLPASGAYTKLAVVRRSGPQVVDPPKRVVLVAGKPSHPPRMHEFNAGAQLLARCTAGSPVLRIDVVLNGWPQDEAIFDKADAIVFYMDGGPNHELVKENGRRLKLAEDWARRGVGIGCMHYGVEVIVDQAGKEFKRWIGGHYENMFSCNPIWEPEFSRLPEHPITRGVHPFRIKDEWYFNMRFVSDIAGNEKESASDLKFQPILVAAPSDEVRDGPYVFPKGPYPHIQASKGRAEAMMWVVERPDGGRGMGFTGGHFHDNWGNDDFRKVVLNSFVWLAKGAVPPDGIDSKVSSADLDANLDPKPGQKK